MDAGEDKQSRNTAKDPLQRFFDGCTDCDICRFLMDESCLVFPEIYRRYDEASAQKRSLRADALRDVTDRCTLCGLCPCPDVRANMIQAKEARVGAEGMEPGARVLSDLQTFAGLGRIAPKTLNALFSVPVVRRLFQRVFHLHPQRALPALAAEGFFHGRPTAAWTVNRQRRRALGGSPILAGARRLISFRRLPVPSRPFSNGLDWPFMCRRKSVAACPRWWKAIRREAFGGFGPIWRGFWVWPARDLILFVHVPRAAIS